MSSKILHLTKHVTIKKKKNTVKPGCDTKVRKPDDRFFDWDKLIADHRRHLENEDQIRIEKVEKDRKLQDSWALVRLCKKIILENSSSWMEHEENRKEEKRQQEEILRKEERLRLVGEKKKGYRFGMIQTKITDTIKKITVTDPSCRHADMLQDGEIRKKKEMAEIKQNLWKQWREKAIEIG